MSEAKITNESIDLGEVFVNERRAFTFDLLNQTDDHAFKFEWEPQVAQDDEINTDVNEEINDNENQPKKKNEKTKNDKNIVENKNNKDKLKKKDDKVEEAEKIGRVESSKPPSTTITFHPSCGHIMPRSSKQISVVFQSDEPVLYEFLPLCCLITPIGYLRESNIFNWDCLMKQTKWLAADKKDVSQLKRYAF